MASHDDLNLLAELGVRNSSVLLANCTIWVEGVTDRTYFRRLLDLYQNEDKDRQKFVENIHYSFVEYSGGNITHWSFLDEDNGMKAERLCGRLFLISDRDNEKLKQERRKQLTQTLGDHYRCLTVREIENILMPQVIKAILLDFKEDAANINDVTHDQYKDKPLGRFIEDEMLRHNRKRKASYAEESGTTKDKAAFCKKAVGHIKSMQDVDPDTQDIVKSFYYFITRHNRSLR